MKRALITAATSSIGKVIARKLAQAGYDLVLHFNTNKELATKLAEDLKAQIVQADLSDEEQVVQFLTDLQELPKFDVIINNAAIAHSLDDKDVKAWEMAFLVNSIVPALVMARSNELVNDDGVIINISSAYGHERFGDKDLAAYDSSKAALNSLTRTFAKKLATRVRVNAIAPGYVHSKWNEDRSAEDLKRLGNEQLTGKLVEPEQVADLAVHIIDNTALDGEVIYLDGGLTLKTI